MLAGDVRDFILACDNCCRKVKPIHETDVVEEQHPISIVPMPNEVMVQIGGRYHQSSPKQKIVIVMLFLLWTISPNGPKPEL